MPAILVYTNVTPANGSSPIPQNAPSQFLMCPTVGIGYQTRPERNVFIPLPLGQIDYPHGLTCPNITPGQSYRYHAVSMHTYMTPDECLLFVEMLALVAGFDPITVDFPHLGKVTSHAMSVISGLQDESVDPVALPLLIAHCSMSPVFCGAPLLDLCCALRILEQKLDRTILTRNAWIHQQTIKLREACAIAAAEGGMVVLGR